MTTKRESPRPRRALEQVIELAGSTDLACHLVFEVERDYWQSRNAAARAQKARQDRLGLGWANHDHHTFRCSRRFFPRVIGMFSRLGFDLRERFHAGEHAGWGAQFSSIPSRASSSSPTWTWLPKRRPKTLPTCRCRTCRGPARSACGSFSTVSRFSKPACIIWKLNSTSTPCATA